MGRTLGKEKYRRKPVSKNTCARVITSGPLMYMRQEGWARQHEQLEIKRMPAHSLTADRPLQQQIAAANCSGGYRMARRRCFDLADFSLATGLPTASLPRFPGKDSGVRLKVPSLQCFTSFTCSMSSLSGNSEAHHDCTRQRLPQPVRRPQVLKGLCVFNPSGAFLVGEATCKRMTTPSIQ